MTGKILIKKGLSYLLAHCGLFSLLERRRLLDKAFVLMYHRVLTPEELKTQYVQPGMYVLRSSFDRQIAFLKKKFRVLFIDDLLMKVRQREDISGCCAITFDDGWRDNFTNAFPILKRYQTPATIFLATHFIGASRLFWPEEICWHLEQRPLVRYSAINSSIPVRRFCRQIEKYSYAKRNFFLNKAVEVLKASSPDERNMVLEHFRGMNNSCYLPRQILNWEEAVEMRKSGIMSFGAHTAQHEILDQLPISKARAEISQAKKDIELRLGVKVNTFAYPNGGYNEDILKILHESDFGCAVTTKRGFLGQNTPRMEIPRIGIHEDISHTVPMFQGRILLEKF